MFQQLKNVPDQAESREAKRKNYYYPRLFQSESAEPVGYSHVIACQADKYAQLPAFYPQRYLFNLCAGFSSDIYIRFSWNRRFRNVWLQETKLKKIYKRRQRVHTQEKNKARTRDTTAQECQQIILHIN